MKPHFGLKFAVLIGLMLCAAMALRVLAANKEKKRPQFRVEINSTAQTNCKDLDEFKQKLLNSQSLVEPSVCLHWDGQNSSDWCGKHKKGEKPARPVQTMSPPPHIQQTVEFTSPAGVKALADALVPTTSPPPPPPHIQQTAGVDSPQRDKVIAEALQR
jgi:hypothetical protein